MNENGIVRFFLQKKAIFMAIIFTLLGIVPLISIYAYINYTNKITHHFTQEAIIEKENFPIHKESQKGLHFEMKIPLRRDGVLNCWEQDNTLWGAQYDVYINNNTSNKIKNWKLKLIVPETARIDSSWNGFYKQNKNTITITPSKEALNDEILPSSFCKLGFVLYTEKLLTETDFSFESNFERPLFSCKPFLIFLIITIVGLFLLVVTFTNYIILKHQQIHAEKEISELLKLCARFIYTRDEYTKKHSSHVATYSKMLAEELGYNQTFQQNIYNIGMLHDVGKVLIPRVILCKPGKLSEEEWQEMKKHTIYGADVLKDFEGITNVHQAALYHHERYDGKGYMEGLKGEDIPLEARIVCVADSFDAMATDRAYRPHLPKEIIINELEKDKGTQFDPKIAQAMLNLIAKGKIKI